MIERYLAESEKIRPLGKTKRATLKAIAATLAGDLQDSQITRQRLVEVAPAAFAMMASRRRPLVMIGLTWAQCFA
jgi:hypothetical protein